MTAFATAEDLATWMQRDFTAAETATATQALDIATDIIRTYTGQFIEEVEETVTLRAERGNSGVLKLSQIPVTDVATVTEDGTLLVLDDDYEWSRAGILWRVDEVAWVHPVVVEYTHGFATIPLDIRGVTLSLASGMFGSSGSGDIKSESIGMYQVTYGQDSSGGMGITERAVLDRYRG